MLQLQYNNVTIKMKSLTKRQSDILSYIRSKKTASNREIKEFLEKNSDELSRITVVRDMDTLIKNGFIKNKAKGER